MPPSDTNQTPCHLRYSFIGLAYNQAIMTDTPSSTTSECATTEAAETYEHWFRAKVLASLKDDRPAAPHETVMAQLRKIVTPQTDGHAADSMEG